MSKTQRTLVEFNDADGGVSAAESDENSTDKQPDWIPAQSGSYSGAEQLQCECGRPLTAWASPYAARRAVRHYGDDSEGTVPGCPGCVEWRDNDDERVESIPHAIQYMETESTTEAHDHRELLVEHARREGADVGR